jgi:hypothetical protein
MVLDASESFPTSRQAIVSLIRFVLKGNSRAALPNHVRAAIHVVARSNDRYPNGSLHLSARAYANSQGAVRTALG